MALYYFLKMKTIYIPNFKTNYVILEKIFKYKPSKYDGALTFLKPPQIDGTDQLFLDIIIPYLEITTYTYEFFIKRNFPLCDSLKQIPISYEEKIHIFLTHRNFAENIMEQDACEIAIYYLTEYSQNIVYDFLKFKQHKLMPNNIYDILNRCLNIKSVLFVLKKNNLTEDMLKDILSVRFSQSSTFMMFYKNYLNYKKYDEEEPEELNEKYLIHIEPNTKIIKNELKTKIIKFFNVSKNLCFAEMLKKILEYLIKNELVIEKYFIIDENLNNLLNIEIHSTLHINTLSNIVTHFYL
jgi:hypothetical protein